MATLFRPNGDAQPVFALDIANGAQTGNITPNGNALVQMAGPKLDFYAAIVKNGSAQAINLQSEAGNVTDPGVIQTVNQLIQQSATIAFYQIQADNTGQISYGLYPAGAYTATTLQQAIQAGGNVQITNSSAQTRGVNVSGTTVTGLGFKLATS